MTPFLVFNHQSLPFESKELAFSAIPEFLRICVRSQSIGLSTILVDESVDGSWFRLALSKDFFWQDWYRMNNGNEHKDLVRAFRSITTRQPFFSKDIGDDLTLFEVLLDGEASYSALRAAVWYETPIVSFPARSPWDSSPIEVRVNRVEANSELASAAYSVPNFHSLSAVKSMEADILRKRDAAIRSGKEILARKNDLYPSVIFCGKAEQQLSNWAFSNTLLEQAKESFSALNSFAEQWGKGEIAAYSDKALIIHGLNHKVSGESETVLHDPSLRKEREFWLPEGSKVLFEKHVKLSNGLRLHFYPDTTTKKIYVGYIGPHLRLR